MGERRKIGEILVAEGLLTDVQLKAALGEQTRWGNRLGETVVQMGFVEETDLVRILSRTFGFPGVDLRDKTIEPHVLEKVPAEIASKYNVMPLFVKREGSAELLYLGMEEPANLTAIDEVSFRTGLGVRPVVVGPIQMRRAHADYYGGESPDDEASGDAPFSEAPVVSGDTAPMIAHQNEIGDDDLVAPPTAKGSWTATDVLEREIEPESLSAAAPVPLELDPEDLASDEGPALEADDDDDASEGEGAGKPRDVPTRRILHALVKILIERDLITRDELMDAVREAGGDPNDA